MKLYKLNDNEYINLEMIAKIRKVEDADGIIILCDGTICYANSIVVDEVIKACNGE